MGKNKSGDDLKMEALKDCYQKQLDFYREIFSLTHDEEKAIQEGNYQKLILLTQQKDKIIQKIEKIKKKMPAAGRSLNMEEQKIVESIILLLKKILNQDKKNQSLLKENMLQTMQDLQKINKTRLLQKIYKGSSEPAARFLDQKK